MLKIKELKQNRSSLYQESRDIRKNLGALITEAKTANDLQREDILEQIISLNNHLNKLLAEIEKISEEIVARQSKGKPKNKKVRKVHNIAGRSIDPTGFSGIVQGGSPGGGKRR